MATLNNKRVIPIYGTPEFSEALPVGPGVLDRSLEASHAGNMGHNIHIHTMYIYKQCIYIYTYSYIYTNNTSLTWIL